MQVRCASYGTRSAAPATPPTPPPAPPAHIPSPTRPQHQQLQRPTSRISTNFCLAVFHVSSTQLNHQTEEAGVRTATARAGCVEPIASIAPDSSGRPAATARTRTTTTFISSRSRHEADRGRAGVGGEPRKRMRSTAKPRSQSVRHQQTPPPSFASRCCNHNASRSAVLWHAQVTRRSPRSELAFSQAMPVKSGNAPGWLAPLVYM